MSIEDKVNGRRIACICDFDKNDNEYNHEFFFIDDGSSADSTAYRREFRKMEDVAVFECSVAEAQSLGLSCFEDIM